MERKISLLSWLLLLTFSLFISQIASQDNRQTYIVYMGSKPKGQLSTSALHMSMLRQVAGRNFGPESLLYHYRKSFDGFVVKLTEEEATKMAGMSGVVSVFPNRKLKPHTTRSWDFMGFSQQVERATTESDVIIGVIDDKPMQSGKHGMIGFTNKATIMDSGTEYHSAEYDQRYLNVSDDCDLADHSRWLDFG